MHCDLAMEMNFFILSNKAENDFEIIVDKNVFYFSADTFFFQVFKIKQAQQHFQKSNCFETTILMCKCGRHCLKIKPRFHLCPNGQDLFSTQTLVRTLPSLITNIKLKS